MQSSPGGQQRRFKLVLLGDCGVGKSCLVLRLIKNEFPPFQHTTIGASFYRHTVPLDDIQISFDIWDTAGQERYKGLASMYYRGAAAAIVVFDMTVPESFSRAQYWVRELVLGGSENIVIALAGNKCDLVANRRVSREVFLFRVLPIPLQEAESYARENGLLYMETSAKASINVTELFVNIARTLAKTLQAPPPPTPDVVRIPVGGSAKPKKKCCGSGNQS